ncbi:hypothetical protein V6N13_139020 [Hibiscus sabdariffa]|uniref:Calcium uniporter protein n=1 Tax=Hibiscus sabdariffa TaxID=183260 RepID=A0ABR2PKK3_9ROSI
MALLKALGKLFVGISEDLIGEKLREKRRGINIIGDRLRLEGITQLQPVPTDATASDKVCVGNARKLLRVSQIEKLKAKLREIPQKSISYHEFVRICLEGCGDEANGLELAKVLDHAGNAVVFLRPEHEK